MQGMSCVAGDITDDVAQFPYTSGAAKTTCKTAEDTLKALKYTAATGSYMYMAPEVRYRLALTERVPTALSALIRNSGATCVT